PLHVGIANINSSGQCVISGGVAGVSEAGDALARRGARVVPLNVSAAYHSRYMKTASEQFKRELDTYRFRPAQYPVVSNMDTGLYSDNSDMPALLSKHMTAPVLWSDTMTYLADHDVRYVIELGPKNTLCRFFGDFPDIPAWPIDNDEEMNAMLARLGQDCAIWIKQFMAVCVGTENLNSDAKAYEEGAVKPYRRLEETVGRIESGEWLPYGEILRQAFNDMKKVLAAKRVPRCEMEEIYGDLELSDQLMKERHT
ncbi:MAG: hypothetical protein LBV27_01215, partial [Oscillospiraceae bacterium]|nr:hypothetical protein [Oscillospiraceae bacterium]